MAPKRIQRKRQRGWRKPANTVCVDRTSRWGNPFRIDDAMEFLEVDEDEARRICIDDYRAWLNNEPGSWEYGDKQRQWILDHVHELKGKDLACFCPEGQLCHADILLDMAAETEDDNAAGKT